ncbi:MAG: ATP-binding protein [Aquihabitans sp.]
MSTNEGPVELSVPAERRYLRLARLTASGFASDLGVSMDDVEELRLAVDEACAALVEEAVENDRLTLTYAVESGAVVITAASPLSANGPVSPHPVAAAVLSATVDEYHVEVDAEGRNVIRLVKRLALRD